jgi:hypothetical protein
MDFSNHANKSDFQNMNQYKGSQSVTTTVTALKNLSSIGEYSVCSPLESLPDIDTNLVLGCEGKLSGMNKESSENESECRWLKESVVDFSGLTFPQKMHHVLKSKEIGDIVTWLPSGKSFVIRSPKTFISEVVPKYFGKNIAFTSFTRRLGRWGWQNIARATYFNPNFCRDHPGKCLLMTYSLSNKQGNLKPVKGINSLKRAKIDELIKEPSYSIPNKNLRHLASNAASEKANFKTSSIQNPLPELQQFAFSPNLQCCAPLLSFQYSSADSVEQQGFAGGKVGIVKPPIRSSSQQTNLVGLLQPILVGNHAKALYRSQMEFFLRRRLVVQAASQANVLFENYKLAIALSALEEASKSFGRNDV